MIGLGSCLTTKLLLLTVVYRLPRQLFSVKFVICLTFISGQVFWRDERRRSGARRGRARRREGARQRGRGRWAATERSGGGVRRPPLTRSALINSICFADPYLILTGTGWKYLLTGVRILPVPELEPFFLDCNRSQTFFRHWFPLNEQMHKCSCFK